MNFHKLYDDIAFTEFKDEVKSYSWEKLKSDLMTGFSVSMITVPQAMAFSLVAGLPLICGLLAAIFSSLATAAFGSSRHLVCGPGNAMSIMIQAVTAEIFYTHYSYLTGWEKEMMTINILMQLAFLVGVFQITAAFGKLGKLTQFVSHSVTVGYVLGTAFAVLVGQFYTFVGIPSADRIGSLFQKAVYVFTHLKDLHLPTAVVGIGSMFLIVFFQRIDRRLPASALMLAIVSLIVYTVGYFTFSGEISWELSLAHSGQKRIALVGDAGEVSEFSGTLSLPYFDPALMNTLLPVSFAIALLGILETTSVAKSVAANSGQRLSVNQDILGLGLGNFISSMIGAMPISGSLSRTSMIYRTGGRTRFAAIFNCLFVLVLVLSLGVFISRIPQASLAAILLIHCISMVNREQFLLCLKATSSDFFVMWTTFFACVFFSFDIAFYIGVALSIILYLKKAAIPQLVEYTIDESGALKSVRFRANPPAHALPIRVIKVEGELFFGAAEIFQTTLQTIAEGDTTTEVLILQMKNARDLDATSCLALRQLRDFLTQSDRQLIISGITYPIWEVLSHADMIHLIGKDNLFIVDDAYPQKSMEQAFKRAKQIIEEKKAKMLLEESTSKEQKASVLSEESVKEIGLSS